MHGEAEELVCGIPHHSGAVCGRVDDHKVHQGKDPHGKVWMWTKSDGKRGPRQYPRVGDNIRDFPDYKG